MCGDPYPVELILGPLLHHQNCWRSSTRPDTIILETYLGFDRRRVQITLTSYHRKSTLVVVFFSGNIMVTILKFTSQAIDYVLEMGTNKNLLFWSCRGLQS